MSKTRDLGNITNVIKTDANGNITFVSGSATLFSISSSGAVTTTGVISGSAAASATSASYAVTSSYADAFTVKGQITAQTLVVQTITSSVEYSSGSNVFGNSVSNTHRFTGSLLVTGSATITGLAQTNTSNGNLYIGNAATVSNGVGIYATNTAVTAPIPLELKGSTIQLTSYNGGSNVSALQITGSGAATFSNSVAATNAILDGTGTYILTLNNSSQDTRLAFSNSGTQNLQISTSNSQVNIYGATNIPMLFYTNATERMRITNGGLVGIGTSSPSSTLHVVGTQLFDGTGATFKRTGVLAGQNWNLGIDSVGLSIYDNTNSAYRLSIGSSGNVGINTTQLNAPGLTIYQPGSDQRVLLELNRPNNPGLQTALQFTVGNSIMVGQIQHEYAGSNLNHMSFSLRNPSGGNFVSMWLNNDGNVGIGTTTPSYKLSVTGRIGATDLILQGSTSLSYSYTTDSSWTNFQTIIPTGSAADAAGVYLVKVQWGSGGSPYVVYAPFLWMCMGSNGAGADNTITPMISTHQGGTGSMNFRNLAGYGQTQSGIQAQLVGFANTSGTLTVVATRLM